MWVYKMKQKFIIFYYASEKWRRVILGYFKHFNFLNISSASSRRCILKILKQLQKSLPAIL